MKSTLMLFVLVLCAPVWGATINLEPVDQQKIAVLLGELPRNIRTRSIVKVEKPVAGMKIKNVFPAGPLSFECTSLYFGKSHYFTETSCKVSIDMTSSEVVQQYGELRVIVQDPKIVQGLFKTIPYGKPEKSLWGWERDQGTNFDGYRAPLFHFRVNCSEKQCRFYFSSYRLVK